LDGFRRAVGVAISEIPFLRVLVWLEEDLRISG